MLFFRRHKRLNTEQKRSHIEHRRVHLANERTFLAWIRTAISVMALGFIVEKFSLFLWIDFAKKMPGPKNSLIASNLLGIVFIGLGGIMGLLAITRFMHVEKEIENNTFHPSAVMDLLFALICLYQANEAGARCPQTSFQNFHICSSLKVCPEAPPMSSEWHHTGFVPVWLWRSGLLRLGRPVTLIQSPSLPRCPVRYRFR